MIIHFIFLSSCILISSRCNDIHSVEINRLEFSPFYDAIIFSDIAEIMNEMDANFKPETLLDSESASEEDIELLLSEYNNYLEKAQKQREKYLEKNKGKNKVPLVRHEKFAKANFQKIHSLDKARNYFSNNIQAPNKLNNPFLIPMALKPPESIPTLNKIIWNENRMSDLIVPKPKLENDAYPSSCFCEDDKFPCKCKCKQCLIPLERTHAMYFEPNKVYNKIEKPIVTSNSYKSIEYPTENNNDLPDNNLNIRIKVDIQIPKIDAVLKRIHKSFSHIKKAISNDAVYTEDLNPANISLPYLDLPIPLNIFTHGLSKLYHYSFSPLHKISINKKKKTHSSNQTKKHRSKLLSFHRGKGNSYFTTQTTEKYENENFNQTLNNTLKLLDFTKSSNISDLVTLNTTDVLPKQNETFANMPIFINLSSYDNSIELETTSTVHTDYTRWVEPNKTTEGAQIMRVKREDDPVLESKINSNNSNIINKVKTTFTSDKKYEIHKSNDLILESDLLYWPSEHGNQAKNMTIKENKEQLKQKSSNISKPIINKNTILQIEKTFKKINWNDTDTIASTFTTLVGKNVNGILTFCSISLCQSLKCANKTCLRRICKPEQRIGQKGHCNGVSNENDTILSMETSLNPTSNIAYDLVDHLQNNMIGQMFGQATICVDVKCISFQAMKNYFTKMKCLKKEINPNGHCENFKNVKTA